MAVFTYNITSALINARNFLSAFLQRRNCTTRSGVQLRCRNARNQNFQAESMHELYSLGVHTAFSNQADFSNISGKKGDLYVSKIIQKAFIDVNEEGVEATAATELEVKLGSIFQLPEDFIVDHPFIYYIKANDVILFAGKVSDPSY